MFIARVKPFWLFLFFEGEERHFSCAKRGLSGPPERERGFDRDKMVLTHREADVKPEGPRRDSVHRGGRHALESQNQVGTQRPEGEGCAS